LWRFEHLWVTVAIAGFKTVSQTVENPEAVKITSTISLWKLSTQKDLGVDLQCLLDTKKESSMTWQSECNTDSEQGVLTSCNSL